MVSSAVPSMPVVYAWRTLLKTVGGVNHKTTYTYDNDNRATEISFGGNRGLATQLVIVEGVGHVRRVTGRVVGDRLDAVVLVGVGIPIGLAVRRGFYARHTFRFVVGIVHRLTIRIGHAGQRAVRSINNLMHFVAASILGYALLSNKKSSCEPFCISVGNGSRKGAEEQGGGKA